MNEEILIRELYHKLLAQWNNRNAKGMAELISEDGNMIGFDGSQMNGRKAVESVIGEIFKNHKTASFISIVKEVRFLNSETAVLRAVVGMVPPGMNDINPEVNAIQTLVAHRKNNKWEVEIFQNTPAAFHGRPELSEKLTNELRQVLLYSSKK